MKPRKKDWFAVLETTCLDDYQPSVAWQWARVILIRYFTLWAWPHLQVQKRRLALPHIISSNCPYTGCYDSAFCRPWDVVDMNLILENDSKMFHFLLLRFWRYAATSTNRWIVCSWWIYKYMQFHVVTHIWVHWIQFATICEVSSFTYHKFFTEFFISLHLLSQKWLPKRNYMWKKYDCISSMKLR